MAALSDLLNKIELGEPVAASSAFFVPIFGADEDLPHLMTFDEALEGEALLINETSLSGSVPELVIENLGDVPVFLLDGEQVLGIKQNRTFNLSMVVPARNRTTIPVSCLESGRWAMRPGKVEAAEHVHFATGRANKMRSVSESLAGQGTYHSDQSRVWGDINARLSAHSVASSTSAEADYCRARRDELQPRLDIVEMQPGQCGFAVVIGTQIVGVDLFGSSRLFARLGRKLLHSYMLDVVDRPPVTRTPPLNEILIKIHKLFAAKPNRFPAPGEGETLRWSTEDGDGAALIRGGHVVHAVAFAPA